MGSTEKKGFSNRGENLGDFMSGNPPPLGGNWDRRKGRNVRFIGSGSKGENSGDGYSA